MQAYRLFLKQTCQRCGLLAEDSCQLDVDHIDGRAGGYPDHPLNLQTLCANCHRLKECRPDIFAKVPPHVDGNVSWFIAKPKTKEKEKEMDFIQNNDVSLGFFDIDAKIANEWLLVNYNNRSPKSSKVAKIATNISIGEYEGGFNSPISFTGNEPGRGELLNGQHRLLAVVLADVMRPGSSIRELVALNCPVEAKRYIDIDLSPRSVADLFRMNGVQDPARLVQACNALEAYNTKQLHHVTGLTLTQTEELINENKDLPRAVEATKRYASSTVKWNGAIPTVLYYLMSQADSGRVDEFFNKIAFGIGLEDDAILTLRNKIISTGNRKGSPVWCSFFMWTVQTWNADVRGTTRPKKWWEHGDSYPTIDGLVVPGK